MTFEFAYLERVVDGKVVWIHPQVWRTEEAKHYAELAQEQGDVINVVPCEFVVSSVGCEPTRSISFCGST